jgi:predicted DNA-binding transcriptional regulator AlpA
METEMLTLVDVTQKLGVSRSTLRRFRKDPRQEFPKPIRKRPLVWQEFHVRRWSGMFIGDVKRFLDSGEGSPPREWLSLYLEHTFEPLGKYNGYTYYDRLLVTATAAEQGMRNQYREYQENKAREKTEAARKRNARREKLKTRTDRARAAAGIVVSPSTPRIFWPSADRRFGNRLKEFGGSDISVESDHDGLYYRKIGLLVPRPCVEIALGERIGRRPETIDILVDLLRTTFYLNKWCRKGHRRGRASDQGRYLRKDRCLVEACKLANEVYGMSWGWNSKPDELLGELIEDEDGRVRLLHPYPNIVYFDLPPGQVSFHVQKRHFGPKFNGEWSRKVNDLFPGDSEPPDWFVNGMKTYHSGGR